MDTDRPTDAVPVSDTADATTTLARAEEAPAEGEGTYVPPLLLVVFGLPILLTLVWFFLQFTRPDRFGRVDVGDLDPEDGTEDHEDGSAAEAPATASGATISETADGAASDGPDPAADRHD